jgi:hypothetical protein
MIAIKKEDGDKILEEFLVQASKINQTKRCAEESFKIMDNSADSQFVISTIIINSIRQQGMFPEYVTDFERQVISALATVFSDAEKEHIPIQLQGIFQGTEEQIIENVRNSKKLHFAIAQFVHAYYEYDLFESKYPEISKMI